MSRTTRVNGSKVMNACVWECLSYSVAVILVVLVLVMMLLKWHTVSLRAQLDRDLRTMKAGSVPRHVVEQLLRSLAASGSSAAPDAAPDAASDAAPECSVCTETAVTDGFTTVCGHVFHVGCLAKWLAHNTTCPNCRGPLFSPAP